MYDGFVVWPRNYTAASSLDKTFARLRVKSNVQSCLARRILRRWKDHFTRIALLQERLIADVRGGEILRASKNSNLTSHRIFQFLYAW